MSAHTPAATTRSPMLKRVLLAAMFAAFGFAAVWQGFGLAGFGTDLHIVRAAAVLVPLVLCGMFLTWSRPSRFTRVVALLVVLTAAGYAWWELPSSRSKSAMSLREAVWARDWARVRLAIKIPEQIGRAEWERDFKLLLDQYPSLCSTMPEEYERWAIAVADDIVAGYAASPPGDTIEAKSWDKSARALSAAHPASADRLADAREKWIAAAVRAKAEELQKVLPGAWEAFNGSAFGRRALAVAFPETRDALLRVEAEWVDASAEAAVAKGSAGGREFWKQTHWELLALKALDDSDGRFAAARGRLFRAAHNDAVRVALGHFEAGRYDQAFGTARTHAVEWTAAAAVLGPPEQKAVADLRSTYEFFAALAAKSAPPPEPAPPPRPKP